MESILINKSKFQLSETTREKLALAVRWLCMALFWYTAYAKVIEHDRFLTGLTLVHLISRFAVFLSFAVPIFEFIIGLLLIIPKTGKIGLVSFIIAMTAFTLYIISALIWEKDLPCHCGGAIERLSWSQHIWFNIAFILIAVFAVWLIKSDTFKKLQNEKF